MLHLGDGSDITVQVPCGARRNYSLSGDPADTHAYQIAVKRDMCRPGRRIEDLPGPARRRDRTVRGSLSGR